MGFFSFLTADTQESIANTFSGERVRTVYLLQPGGKPPIEEVAYEGYGKFGGVDCYEWLAEMNFGNASLHSLAVNFDCGHYHEDGDAIYVCSLHIERGQETAFRVAIGEPTKTIVFFDNYQSRIAEKGGATMNSLIKDGTVEEKLGKLKYPLKFSFRRNARYESLQPSESCPHQGYFYD